MLNLTPNLFLQIFSNSRLLNRPRTTVGAAAKVESPDSPSFSRQLDPAYTSLHHARTLLMESLFPTKSSMLILGVTISFEALDNITVSKLQVCARHNECYFLNFRVCSLFQASRVWPCRVLSCQGQYGHDSIMKHEAVASGALFGYSPFAVRHRPKC